MRERRADTAVTDGGTGGDPAVAGEGLAAIRTGRVKVVAGGRIACLECGGMGDPS